jgi:endonuclease/exonuclease/phosphatase (EEP) superfamily protein YafD
MPQSSRPIFATARGVLAGLALGLAGAALVASLLGWLGGLWWGLDLAAQFWPQGLLLGVAATGAGLMFRRRRLGRWCLGLAGAAVVVSGVALLAFGRWSPVSLDPTRPTLSVMHFNIGDERFDPAAQARWLSHLDQLRPDIVLLQEMSGQVHDRLLASPDVMRRYRIVAANPRQVRRGTAVLIRADHADAWAFEYLTIGSGPDLRPTPVLHGQLAGQPIAIANPLHARPAPGPQAREQRQNIQQLAAWTLDERVRGRHVLLIGDFNAAAWSAPSRRLEDDAGVQQAPSPWPGRGTWPSALPWPLRVPIDHAYATPGLLVSRPTIGPHAGSDHRPITVRVQTAEPDVQEP